MAEITRILNYINMQETHFMRDYCVFLIHLYDGRNTGRMDKQYFLRPE
jgi:hypothetical protein